MPDHKTLANAIRFLSADAVQKANSGHPGAPMGMADMAEVLWNDFLKHNPANPAWPDRDRVVLSNGHASMLLYAVLHLTGYDLSIEDIKNFRQMGSKTAGHPEYGHTPGVETTTGPLGQGVANAVGMALAESMLAAQFNKPGHEIVDHHTYVLLGDGCMMEGVSHEAASLAGALGLGKLIALYDDNGISIDGDVSGWFSDDTPARFEAYGWHVLRDVDGHDAAALHEALAKARAVSDKPSLVCCKTEIGYGAPGKCGKASCHGSPLGEETLKDAREHLGWSHPPFEVPDDIYGAWNAREKGAQAERAWVARFEAYKAAYPELAESFTRRMAHGLPGGWDALVRETLREMAAKTETIATRKASLAVLNAFAPALPELVGGSADLSGSNGTLWKGVKSITRADKSGNYIHFGVREMAMAALCTGISLHGGFIPYCATFLVFSDYARNAIRMAALMRTRNIFILTHDSIGVGEDGPTHQPVEHAASLRLIPNIEVWRPADLVETTHAWNRAVSRQHGPTALLLTRQGLPALPHTEESVQNAGRGGYVISDCQGAPDLVLMGTGSELGLCLEAAAELSRQGRKVRVVSLPCPGLFLAQEQSYRDAVLPPRVAARLAVEAGSSDCWHRFTGDKGRIIGMDDFGLSAPGKTLFAHFGFTVANVVKTALEML